MAASFVRAGQSANSGTSATLAADCTGVNVLFVGVHHLKGTTVSATYAGAAMTQIATVTGNTVDHVMTVFKKTNPATGTNNIVVTPSATSDPLGILWQGWSGVDTTTTNRTAATNHEDDGNTSVSLLSAPTQVSGDTILDFLGAYSGGVSPGAGQTSRAENDSEEGGSYCMGTSSIGATGSTSPTWTISANGFWAYVAFAIIDAATGVTITPGAGSELLTGRVNNLAFAIGMPDQP